MLTQLDRSLLALAVMAAGYGLAAWSLFGLLVALGLWLFSAWLCYWHGGR